MKEGIHMIDVTGKSESLREARAEGNVYLTPEMMEAILHSRLPKGNVLEAARLAGIMAAKNTPNIIPLCHPIPITAIEVEPEVEQNEGRIHIQAVVKSESKTGVEMEALTAVCAAALTVYDMCKAMGQEIRLGDIRLTYKSGGRNGTFQAGLRENE